MRAAVSRHDAMKLAVSAEVAAAIAARRPVVALESTVIAHGLPRPMNLETARAMEDVVRACGATPATIAIADGAAVVGADAELLARLATDRDVAKVSVRDLAPLLARRGVGATTVAATVEIAARTGIGVMATGGIGGVHRGAERTFDESADLGAIGRNAVCVVCAGAKLVLDLARTLERLETLGVPVVGYGTDEFPAFYVRSSGLPLPYRADDALAAARIAREQLARGAGVVVAVPIATADGVDRATAEAEVARAIAAANDAGVRGAALTPYLLGAVGEATGGRSLRANVSLLLQNARVAAQIALALAT
jgi:pseudouridine-5'-phosphate glycosidase